LVRAILEIILIAKGQKGQEGQEGQEGDCDGGTTLQPSKVAIFHP
jgi:hypothetical protein